LIAAVKTLFKDSIVYGLANVIQKIIPLVIIPVIIAHLGKTAFKLYDLSFVYAYLFSSLVVLGQDSAASVFYFDKTNDHFNKKQVLAYSFFIQVFTILGYLIFFYPFRHEVASFVFHGDSNQAHYWIMALSVIPGYFMFNYGLNILLINRRKVEYISLCFLLALLSIAGTYTTVVVYHGGISDLFYVLIGSMTVCGLIVTYILRKDIFTQLLPLNYKLLDKLVWFGLPFALTSFFRQVIPSIDRYFLLKFNYTAELPQYILAVKLGSFINIAFSAFALAFTPYSLSKIHHEDGEKEISNIFHIVSVLSLTFIPVVLIFKNPMVDFFADASYGLSSQLLPFFLFGWAFDLFTNFALLGIYKSQKSIFILTLLMAGTLIVSVLNILLVPVYGVFGAAISFCLTKLVSFAFAVFYLNKHFKLHIDYSSFIGVVALTGLCSFLNYFLNSYLYLAIMILVLTGIGYFLYSIFKKSRLEQLMQPPVNQPEGISVGSS
jgi:O-antigen/teichoic acid export membrane protein